MNIKKLSLLVWSLLGLTLVNITGCAPMGAKAGQISIDTTPPGAEVFVFGRAVGTSPMSLPENLIFPTNYAKGQEGLYGMVELRLAKCKSSQHRVSSDAISNGLNVTLDCSTPASVATPTASANTTNLNNSSSPSPLNKPISAAEYFANQSPPPAAAMNPVAPGTAASDAFGAKNFLAERLRILQDLLNRGLISPEEAAVTRKRILDNL